MAACLQVQSWWVLLLSPLSPYPTLLVTIQWLTVRPLGLTTATGPDKGILYRLSSLREVVGSGGGM